MNSLLKTFLVATFGAAAFAAGAGEISGSNIDAYQARNQTFSDDAQARQEIGVTWNVGRILNSTVWARGTSNEAASRGGYSGQYIGVAVGGTMNNSTVWADGARNRSAGTRAFADQQIGLVGPNGYMTNSTIGATQAFNNANNDGSVVTQRIGVVN